MKSIQLSFAFALSSLFIGFTHNPIACQSPTTTPTSQPINKKTEIESVKKTAEENKFVGIGSLNRAVEKRVYPSNMGEYHGKIVFNICIDRSGKIIYATHNKSKSTISEVDAVSKALSAMKRTKFEANPSAVHERECGQWTMKFDSNQPTKMEAAERAAKEKQAEHRELEDEKKEESSEGVGLLNRVVEKRVFPSNMGKYSGLIVFNICINRTGKVIYAKYSRKFSTITDRDAVSEALSALKKTKFEADPSAHSKECGQWTMKFEGN